METSKLGDWRRTHYSNKVTAKLDQKEVTILGWVREVRVLGRITFVILQDREGSVQLTIAHKKAGEELMKTVDSLQKQYNIGVKGVVKKTDMTPRGVEILPSEIRIFNVAKHPLPLDVTDKTPASIDVRLNARPLDLCRDEARAIFKIQHAALKAIRQYLYEHAFIEVHTPRIIASATEGGAALFQVKYFDKEAYLAQSPQLFKEQLVIAFEKVFEIGPFFRAEESHTRRHLSEFISIDVEEAFADAEDVMRLLEKLVRFICVNVKAECVESLKILNSEIRIPTIPFKRFTYDEVLDDLKSENNEVKWGEDIPTPAFRTLSKLHPYFYFITNWPTKSKPFYIKPRDDIPAVCEAFDLMWYWIELASGGTRVNSQELLLERLATQGLHPDSFKYHLKAFSYGMPPHAGWAIGLSRLLMMLTKRKNIREVVLFPRDKYRLTP